MEAFIGTKSKQALVLSLLFVFLGLTFAALVWPTVWSYEVEFHDQKVPGDPLQIRVRFNRFTGKNRHIVKESGEMEASSISIVPNSLNATSAPREAHVVT